MAPPPIKNAPRKRIRKRKRRASVSSSSSSDSSSDDERAPAPVKKVIAKIVVPEDSSSSSSSSSSDSSSDEEDAPAPTTTTAAATALPSAQKLKADPKRPRSPSPSPRPAEIPSFIPPTSNGKQKLEEEQMLKDKFRRFWMSSVADGFKDDLEEIRKEPNLGSSRLALLIDSLASGADVFTSTTTGDNTGDINEMQVVLEPGV